MSRILIVDDEKNIVSALDRLLRSEAGISVEGFTSAKDALSRAEQTEFDVVVVDYRMPEMDGTQFLLKYRAIQPHSYRIILSAFSDESMLRKAINQAQIHALVRKPWDGMQLFDTIKRGAEQAEAQRALVRLHEQVAEQQATIEKLQTLLEQLAEKAPEALPKDWQSKL